MRVVLCTRTPKYTHTLTHTLTRHTRSHTHNSLTHTHTHAGNDVEALHRGCGADLFWRKPVPPPDTAARELGELLAVPLGPWRVLLADDEPVVRFVFARNLREILPGCDIVEFDTGHSALIALETDEASQRL